MGCSSGKPQAPAASPAKPQEPAGPNLVEEQAGQEGAKSSTAAGADRQQAPAEVAQAGALENAAAEVVEAVEQAAAAVGAAAGTAAQSVRQAVETAVDAKQDATEFDGDWSKCVIKGSQLTWTDGSTSRLSFPSPGKVSAQILGKSCEGHLGDDGKLIWSDGDVWERKAAQGSLGGVGEVVEAARDKLEEAAGVAPRLDSVAECADRLSSARARE